MKRVIFLILGVIGFASILSAGEIDYFASVSGTPQPPPVVEDTTPRWKDSLSEIHKTTATLLETNRKLSAEYQALTDQLTVLESDINAQRARNEQLRADIQKKQVDPLASEEAEQLRTQIAQIERAIILKKKETGAVDAKRKALQTRVALQRMRIRELEIEKKTILVGRKPKDELALSGVRAEIVNLQDKIASQNGQEEYVRERITAFKGSAAPQAAEALQLVQDNAALSEKLAGLKGEKADVLRQLHAPQGTDLKRYADLVARKNALAAQMAALKDRKAALEGVSVDPEPVVLAEDVSEDMKKLQEQNRLMEDQIGNLRENIAVLEYKISSIERYRDRNKVGR